VTDPVFRPGPASGIPYLIKRNASLGSKKPAVLMLHGWSGDERVMWVLESVLPETKLIAALRGLYPLPGSGYQWTQGVASLDTSVEAFQAGGKAILSVVDELIARDGLDPRQLILMGFSQGAAISYALAALGMLQPRAIICLAGFLPQGDLHRLSGIPIFWGHGTRDELVPVVRARKDVERLHEAGADVNYCEMDVGHRLGIECTRGLKAWLEMLEDGDAGE